jgi:hypothetical protein
MVFAELIGLVATLSVAVALLLAVNMQRGSGGTAMPSLPVGTFVPNEVIGTASVEADMCVAVKLDADAATSGKATVFWWSSDGPGCSGRESSTMMQAAALRAITLPAANGLAERSGYELAFDVALIPSGSQRIAVSLDPGFASQQGVELAAIRVGEALPSLTFTRVTSLAIPGPEDKGPVPTPVASTR